MKKIDLIKLADISGPTLTELGKDKPKLNIGEMTDFLPEKGVDLQ